MPSSVIVGRELVLRGDAVHDANILGPMQEKKRHHVDRFDGKTLDVTNFWAVAVPGTSDTIAASETVGGSCLITTGTADNDSCMLSSAIIYNGTKLAVVEFRITITDVSGCGVFVGFSDAKSESNNSIAFHYPGGTLTDVAADSAGFVIDGDEESSSIFCVSAKGGAETTPVDTGTDWADGETRNLRVILDSDGVATYVIDGVAVAVISAAVTAGTLLCATVQAITRANDGANTIRVHSFDSWQDN
jgi:hypothetical protein